MIRWIISARATPRLLTRIDRSPLHLARDRNAIFLFFMIIEITKFPFLIYHFYHFFTINFSYPRCNNNAKAFDFSSIEDSFRFFPTAFQRSFFFFFLLLLRLLFFLRRPITSNATRKPFSRLSARSGKTLLSAYFSLFLLPLRVLESPRDAEHRENRTIFHVEIDQAGSPQEIKLRIYFCFEEKREIWPFSKYVRIREIEEEFSIESERLMRRNIAIIDRDMRVFKSNLCFLDHWN